MVEWPEFLGLTEEQWPCQPVPTNTDEINALAEIAKSKTEPRITRSLVNVTDKAPNIEAIIVCRRYRTKIKLLRATALVRRFIHKFRNRKMPAKVELNAVELQAAEEFWVKAIQTNSVQEETYSISPRSFEERSLVGKSVGCIHGRKRYYPM